MLLESGYPEVLFQAACTYLARGWSVIPVCGAGQPDRAKVAAVAWAEFQRRQPTLTELQRWFVEQCYPGLAIVTGRISSLVVLDFDTPAAFTRFYDKLPHLIDTYTVKTHRGHHLYYRLAPGLRLPSRKGRGVDLLSDGKYVVAPPTTINDWTYKVSRNTEPYSLSERDIQRILAFFGPAATSTPEPPPAPELGASIRVSEATEKNCRASSSRLLTNYDLISRYRYRAGREGRNEALFHVSLTARDSGWSAGDVLTCLVDTHVQQPAGKSHRAETHEQRRREAVATIHSAFSRPARICNWRDDYNNGQLPNSVRETLLQMGLTCVVRVIESLRLAGIQPGQALAAGEALQILKGRVGRDSVYQALKATALTGARLFESLPPRTSNPATADTQTRDTLNKKCFVETPQKPGKNQRGRPVHVFVMPGNLDLCLKLGVKASVSDPLTREDLQSAKSTRQALHREFIKRRPGQYPCRWLAERLGVCARTLQAYNREIPIQVQPVYVEMPVTWSTLAHIPDDGELGGTFLQDERGKQYPARREIARYLLSKRHIVVYKRRGMNYYSYGEPPDRSVRPGLHPWSQTEGTKPIRIEVFARQHEIGVPTVNTGALPQSSLSSNARQVPHTPCVSEQQTGPATKPKSRRYYRKPLPDERMEHLAQQVHAQTNPASYGNPHGLSIFNARRLVETYGVGAVEMALKRLDWMQQHKLITNAAGFVVTISRAMWQKQHNAPAPRFQGEPERTARKQYKKPLRNPLYNSESWLRWRADFAETQGDWEEAGFWRSKVKREIPF